MPLPEARRPVIAAPLPPPAPASVLRSRPHRLRQIIDVLPRRKLLARALLSAGCVLSGTLGPMPGWIGAAQAQSQLSPVLAAGTRAPDIAQGVREVSPRKDGKPPRSKSAVRKNDPNAPIVVEGREISGRLDFNLRLQGDARLSKNDLVLSADLIDYLVVPDQVIISGSPAKIERISPEGSDTLFTPRAQIELLANTGVVEQPQITYGRIGGRGKADRIELLAQQVTRMLGAEYTTCRPGDDSWVLKAREITIDQIEGEGEARGAKLYFKGTPILAAPYMPFPVDDERASGFLPPSLGITTRTGLDVTVPIYWNIAPNRDFTFEPRLMTRRGVLLGGLGRYLEPSFAGSVRAEWLPRDEQLGRQRWLVDAEHAWQPEFAREWRGGWKYQKVSDDQYFADVARNVGNINTLFLPREGYLSYTRPWWNVSARVQQFQTLQDPLAPVLPAYWREPQLNFNYYRADVRGFVATANAEFARFKHPTLTEGWRAYLQPALEYPVVEPGYFIRPRVALHMTRYGQLETPGVIPGTATSPRSASRTLPIISVDTGLVFEREQGIFLPHLRQTLEPRLFYLRVPYRDQNALPNFDSAATDFGFAQLFSPNRFSGNDRISDADALTMALTSRYSDPATGLERLRLQIGKRFNFETPRVDVPGTTLPVLRSSDLLLSAAGRISQAWALDTSVQLNSRDNTAVRSSVGLRYSPAERNIFNLTYRYQRELLEQIEFSTQWQLGGRFYAVARWNYSIREKRSPESLAGVEYDADCWVARLVVNRYATATGQANNSLFFQLELSGLGGIGTDPLSLLKRSIPGYSKLDSQRSWSSRTE